MFFLKFWKGSGENPQITSAQDRGVSWRPPITPPRKLQHFRPARGRLGWLPRAMDGRGPSKGGHRIGRLSNVAPLLGCAHRDRGVVVGLLPLPRPAALQQLCSTAATLQRLCCRGNVAQALLQRVCCRGYAARSLSLSVPLPLFVHAHGYAIISLFFSTVFLPRTPRKVLTAHCTCGGSVMAPSSFPTPPLSPSLGHYLKRRAYTFSVDGSPSPR